MLEKRGLSIVTTHFNHPSLFSQCRKLQTPLMVFAGVGMEMVNVSPLTRAQMCTFSLSTPIARGTRSRIIIKMGVRACVAAPPSEKKTGSRVKLNGSKGAQTQNRTASTAAVLNWCAVTNPPIFRGRMCGAVYGSPSPSAVCTAFEGAAESSGDAIERFVVTGIM